MKILALDLAEYKIGWAVGDAGKLPTVDVLKLRNAKETTEQAVAKFGTWLFKLIATSVPPDLVVAEKYIEGGALKGATTFKTRDGAILLNGALRGMCGGWGIPVECPAAMTIRKHFIGRATMGDRDSTKAAVVKQAQLLGYIPKDCFEDNMADAAALFDYASSYWGSKASAFQLTILSL